MSAVGCGCQGGSPVSRGHKVAVALSSDLPRVAGLPGGAGEGPTASPTQAGTRAAFPPLDAALEKALPSLLALPLWPAS